jgi:23S rRNA (adenine2503-C2)-methyltransferase
MERVNIFGLTLPQLEQAVLDAGLQRYRADQIFYWLYNRCAKSFDEMTQLGKAARSTLSERFDIVHPEVVREQRSVDGTRKFLLRMQDGLCVEAVLIPSENAEARASGRLTLCISTQVGCALDCAFCATASLKLKRDLTPGEILGQYLVIRELPDRRVTNIVLMGMGEPLLNYENVMKALDILRHEKSCAVAASRITISTSGIVPGIIRMADDGRREKLALSLHAATDEVRSSLMPVNRRYGLVSIREALMYYYKRTRRRVTFEYILFDGLNDGPDDIRRLVKLCRTIPSKLNLIPFHDVTAVRPRGASMHLLPAPIERVHAFADALRERNITVMLRSSSGYDIDAACGQLAGKAGSGGTSDV